MPDRGSLACNHSGTLFGAIYRTLLEGSTRNLYSALKNPFIRLYIAPKTGSAMVAILFYGSF
jgi:hypothetical protein